MSVFEMARKYYPRLWDKARISSLLAAKKLTQSQYDELIGGKEYELSV